MGRIPNFTNTIFPASSIHLLTLTSTIGLVFFLFIIGIEIDMLAFSREMQEHLSPFLSRVLSSHLAWRRDSGTYISQLR
jgi:Kef-type K+ transport system membrane component KefB